MKPSTKPPRINITSSTSTSLFREPVVVTKKIGTKRYFYCQDQTNTFVRDYSRTNLIIGIKTQVSNLLGFFGWHPDNNAFFRQDLKTRHETSAKRYQTHPDQENEFYQRPQFSKADASNQFTATYIGHASMVFQLGGITIATDPVHYQAGTEGYGLSAAAALLYPRQTLAAIKTTEYPRVDVVWISHNHYDHLCKRSLQEAFPEHTQFVVPVGDKDKLLSWGFGEGRVHEVSSWNQILEIENLEPFSRELTQLIKIHSLPAKHASNRCAHDVNQALFMGCIIQYENNKQKYNILITGDTAVLDDKHYQQLEQWILSNGPIHFACLASGPDRPRSLMACTHQSSADALVYHARLTLANRKYPKEKNMDPSPCYGIAYHQGCYRLGLLSYLDVPSTVMRMLVFLDSELKTNPKLTISELINKIKNKTIRNIYYNIMDEFERQGVLDLLNQYNTHSPPLTIQDIINSITGTFHVPNIGESFDLHSSATTTEPHKLHTGFQLDYSALLVNTRAVTKVKQKFKTILKEYNLLEKFNENNITLAELAELYEQVHGNKTHDEGTRDEGEFQMFIILLANHVANPLQCHIALNEQEHITPRSTPTLIKISAIAGGSVMLVTGISLIALGLLTATCSKGLLIPAALPILKQGILMCASSLGLSSLGCWGFLGVGFFAGQAVLATSLGVNRILTSTPSSTSAV